MTLQQLRYIVAIDDYRHFGKAAEACDLTQSTLSLMVKKLEEELDVRLFDRDVHPVEPTEIGRKVIDRAKVVLYNVKQIAEMTRSEKEVLSGALRIALISTVSPVLVPGLFKYFGEHYPSISLQTEEMLSSTIKGKLRKAEVDMGIMAGPVDDPDFLEIPSITSAFWPMFLPKTPLMHWRVSGQTASCSSPSGLSGTVCGSGSPGIIPGKSLAMTASSREGVSAF